MPNGIAQAARGRKPTRGHKRKERAYNVARGHSRKPKHRPDMTRTGPEGRERVGAEDSS